MSKDSQEIDLSLPVFLLREMAAFTRPPYLRVREQMSALCAAAPQVLLIEGGSQTERLAAGLIWACLLNCEQGGTDLPCLACSTCKRFMQAAHRDFFVLDGREESIKIETVREWVRPVLGEPPREAARRVILFAEAQSLGLEAANALLKSLEEPRPQNAFVLTAPQRERLLPTLVSRSWVLTLPWPEPGRRLGAWEAAALASAPSAAGEEQAACAEWEAALAAFLTSGRGWFGKTGTKGAVTPASAQAILSCLQSALAAALLSGRSSSQGVPHAAAGGPLYQVLSNSLTPVLARRFYEAAALCQSALDYRVNPALVADWLAVRLFVWLEEQRRFKPV